MLTTKKKATRKVGVILTLFIALFMVVSSVLTVNAETLENNSNVLVCEKQEHTHSEECYDQEGNLICGLEEHTHDENCYEAQQENKEEEKQEEETPVVENKEETNTEVDPTTTNNDDQPVEKKEEDNQEVTTPETTEVVEENKEEEPVEETTEEVQEETGVELEVKLHDYTLDDFAFDENSLVSIVLIPICGIEEHEHTEECYDLEGNVICGIEEHIHEDKCFGEESVPAARPKFMLMANPLAELAPVAISNANLVTHEDSGSNHTYLEILDRHYDLHVKEGEKRETYLVLEGGTGKPETDNVFDSLPDKTPVRLALVASVPTNLKGNQEYYYQLPKGINWNPANGEIFYNNMGNVGRYQIANNRVSLFFNGDFLQQNSKIQVRVYVDGAIDARLTGDHDIDPFHFDDIGDIEVNKIDRDAKLLTVNKNVASGLTYTDPEDPNKDITNFIELMDDGTEANKGKIRIWYRVAVQTSNGEITNIKLEDRLMLEDKDNNRIENAVYDENSFRLGTAFGKDDYKDITFTSDNVKTNVDYTKEIKDGYLLNGEVYTLKETEGKEKYLVKNNNYYSISGTELTEEEKNALGIKDTDKTISTQSYSVNINGYDSTDDGNKLYLTYAVIVTPKKDQVNYADNDDKTSTITGSLKNEISANGDDVPQAKTTDEFNYAERPVDKVPGSKPKESFTAAWTVTFNEFGNMTGYVGAEIATAAVPYSQAQSMYPASTIQSKTWNLDSVKYTYDSDNSQWVPDNGDEPVTTLPENATASFDVITSDGTTSVIADKLKKGTYDKSTAKVAIDTYTIPSDAKGKFTIDSEEVELTYSEAAERFTVDEIVGVDFVKDDKTYTYDGEQWYEKETVEVCHIPVVKETNNRQKVGEKEYDIQQTSDGIQYYKADDDKYYDLNNRELTSDQEVDGKTFTPADTDKIVTTVSYPGFSIVAYMLDDTTGKLVRVSDQNRIFATMQTNTDPKTDITNVEDFYKAFFVSEHIEEGDHASHTSDWNGKGIVVPKNVKYVISYQTKVHPKDQEDAPIGDSDVTLDNEASNGDNTSSGGPSDSSDIGVGPAQPTTAKNKVSARADETTTEGNYAYWVLTAEISDTKAQIDKNTIYDYLEPGHTIDDKFQIEFYVDLEKPSDAVSKDPDKKFTWSDNVVSLKYATTKDSTPTKPYEGTAGSPKFSTDSVQEGKYNFSFDLGAAYDSLDGKDLVNGGLPVGKYSIRFRTILDTTTEGPIVPGSPNFVYRNHVFMKLKDQDKVLNAQDIKSINIVNKADLDSNIAAYKAATGDDLSGAAYQVIPWYVSSLVVIDPFVITDTFSQVTTSNPGPKEGDPDGNMRYVEGSLVAYQTNVEYDSENNRDPLLTNWDETKVTRIEPKSVTYLNGNDTHGIVVDFGNIDKTKGSRVIMFYLTEATDDSVENLKSVRYYNTASPNVNPDGGNPSSGDNTPRYYDILDKQAQFDSNDPNRIATYTIDVNKSKLDLNHEGDTVTVTDNLDNRGLSFMASTFRFYKLTLDSSGKITDKEDVTGQEGYTLDASNENTLIITIPDQTPVQIEYKARVTYNPDVHGDTKLVNEVSVEGFKTFSKKADILVTVIKHTAEVTADNFYIRLYKYDQDEPTKALAGAVYRITMYSVNEDTKELELYSDDLTLHPSNPMTVETNEYGEIDNEEGRFHGKYDIVYKIEEIKAPEGYIATDYVEYFVHAGNYSREYFETVYDADGNEINPTVYHIYEDVDEIRYTMANRRASYGLVLEKTDPSGKKALTGAVFNLYKVEENDKGQKVRVLLKENIEVNEEGKIEFVNLEAGKYFLKEVKAPKGYAPYEQLLEFDYDGEKEYKVYGTYFTEYRPSKDEFEPNVLIYKNGIIPPRRIPKTGD